MDRTAYAAGFLDGEGSVGVYRDHIRRDRAGERREPSANHSAVLQASGYDRGPLDLLLGLFGGRVHSGRSTTGHALYHWQLHQQGLIETALRQLLPHLIVKHSQAELAIAFLVWRRSVTRTTGPRAGRTFSPVEAAEAESFAEAIKELKAA